MTFTTTALGNQTARNGVFGQVNTFQQSSNVLFNQINFPQNQGSTGNNSLFGQTSGGVNASSSQGGNSSSTPAQRINLSDLKYACMLATTIQVEASSHQMVQLKSIIEAIDFKNSFTPNK